ncbi:MAG: PSD1 and planctomycete cytochrome C domain-containing protein [Roseibacillus sp.]
MRPTILALSLAASLPALSAPLSYNRDIRPILAENCFACHGPDKGARKAKLRLDLREVALAKEAFVPGDVEASELVYRINADDKDEVMPPPDSHKSLTPEQKKILQAWIKEGAAYEPHWAYLKPVRPAVPAMGAQHPIDNFILAGMPEEARKPSPLADPNTLARRLSFDFLGLPPSSSKIVDPASRIEATVDSLLASPHFGERMAVFWLDLARYADSIGYHNDKVRDVTPYRDYVIRAFNENKPYDKFIIEQLAGDLLENPTTEHYVATGFNRINQISQEGGIQDKEYIAKYYSERVRTTSVAFLGSTMGCSECHDHKFDPFTTKDFYSMEAFFADIYEKGAYNGDGRYNPGADIKKHPGFKLSTWGPAMDVPEADKTDALARIAREKKAAEAELQKTTPELEVAFLDWLADLKSKLGSSKPQDVKILDDKELPLGNIKTVTDNVHSGTIARHQQNSGLVQHIVDTASKPVTMAAGDTLFAYVWLDPKDPPKQIMLQFHADRNWNHRAWWGEDHIPYGKGSKNADHHQAGALPELGKWVRIEVPADKVGLGAGKTITQVAYTQHGGTVLWDLSGRHTDDSNAALAGLPGPARKALVAGSDKALSDKQKAPLFAHYRSLAPALEPIRKKIAKLNEEEKASKGKMRMTLVTVSTNPREIRILPRGNWMDRSGDVMQPAVPAFLSDSSPPATGEARLTRLDLANWIASTDNPLTARTFVNRVWALFFGVGLSRDLQDLGNQGQWPTHPELLDWLSVEFMTSGWDVKRLVKLIATSKTYQQSSNTIAGMMAGDPYNRLYNRQNPRRLPAEFVRDNALAVSGLLNSQIGGASARPYQPAGYYRELNFPKRQYKQDNDANQYRRGIYMHWQRSFLHPMLAAFDAPAREECTAERETSNTPQQALDLLNDPTFVEAARVFAEALMAGGKSFPARLEAGFQRLLNRKPYPAEAALLTALYEKQLARYKSRPADATALLGVGLRPANKELNPIDLAATTAVTRALLNLHETITRY